MGIVRMNPWVASNAVACGVGVGIGVARWASSSSSSSLSLSLSLGISSISIISSISSISSISMRQRAPRRPLGSPRVAAARRETPYEVLGVDPSASARDIKRAYRRLALRFHPDVNKDPNAQERFMRIKHAYNTLISASASASASSSSPSPSPTQAAQEDPFYGLADFLRDLQQEFRNWEADLNPQDKPKSLWEELAAIGEEFVEFLEKELNVNENDAYVGDDPMGSQKEKRQENDAKRQPSVEESIDEVEAALTQLKKELGL